VESGRIEKRNKKWMKKLPVKGKGKLRGEETSLGKNGGGHFESISKVVPEGSYHF